MSDLLGIGASGVRAYQTALSTTSENIANSGNAGYVRRTTSLAEVGNGSSLTGNGVVVNGIARSTDVYQSATVRAANSDLTRTDATVNWLDRIDQALSGQGLSERMTDFFNAAQQVAADPSASAPRAVMLENAGSAAEAFTATGTALDRIDTQLDGEGQSAADKLTSAATGLARVNGALAQTQPGSSGQATLLDQRDQLLDTMSGLTDISVSYDTLGRATVRGGNSTGPLLVEGTQSASASFSRNSDGAVAFNVLMKGNLSTLSPGGGAMAGLAEGAQRVASARSDLSMLATDFADGVNAVQANGRDLNGNPGAPIFATDPDNPTRVSVALTDWKGIAAAGVGGGPRDNSNLADLASLRTSGDYESSATALITANAAALSTQKTVSAAQTAIHDQAKASLASASGVDLDSEAVDLMRFQQAYQASSRVIQVARETIQTLLQIN